MTNPPPDPDAVRMMAAFDELCRLNPRLREMMWEADLNTEAQLQILKQNARGNPFFDNGGDIYKEVRNLEQALRNHLKEHPPLTRRPRRGRL